MRERIEKEKGTDDIWDLKQVRGGLVDLEFIAQYLQLMHAAAHPEVLDQNTVEAFRKLRDAGLLAPQHADVLIPATRLLHDLTQILRLCLEGPFRAGHGAVRASRRCLRGRAMRQVLPSWRRACGQVSPVLPGSFDADHCVARGF